MLRITKDKDEIIVRVIPVREWITVGIAALILVFIVTVWLVLRAPISDSMRAVPIFAFLGCFVFFLLLTNTATTIKINKPGKTVSIRKQSLFKYSFDVYSFSEIADLIYVDASYGGSRGNEVTTYQIIMPLKNGTNIELPAFGGLKDSEYIDVVDSMNPYIFDTSKQIPFKLTVFNDD